VPEDKTSPVSTEPAISNSANIFRGPDFYHKLVQRHRSLVEDHSRIEARIRQLESLLDEALTTS
jgi:hypothetical protein